MATYSFVMPIQHGKTETFKRYAMEMSTGSRHDDFQKRNDRLGLSIVQVWLQHTPSGDFAVIRWEADDPRRAYEQMLKSNDPFDVWFREKIIVEVFGRNLSDHPPPMNEQLVDYQGQRSGKPKYEEAKKR